MKKVLAIFLLALILVVPLAAASVNTISGTYSFSKGSFLGIDYTSSPTSLIGAYGGIYGLFGLGDTHPDSIISMFAGPGFNIYINNAKSLSLLLAVAAEVPVCISVGQIGLGLGVMADVGIRWNPMKGEETDDFGLYISGGVKGSYYFGFMDFGSNDTEPVKYRISPYLGIGISF